MWIHPFFLLFYFKAALEAIHYVKSTLFISLCLFHNTFCSHPLSWQAVYDWFREIWRLEEYCVYLRKSIAALLFHFKGANLFDRTSCSNVSWKSTVFNALREVPLFHGKCVDLTISQQQLQSSISMVKVSEENLLTFALSRWLFDAVLSPKSYSFGVLSLALIFFRGAVVFEKK